MQGAGAEYIKRICGKAHKPAHKSAGNTAHPFVGVARSGERRMKRMRGMVARVVRAADGRPKIGLAPGGVSHRLGATTRLNRLHCYDSRVVST